MAVHLQVTVYSVEGIGWKQMFCVEKQPRFYVEVVMGSKHLISSREVGIVDDACAWEEKLPLTITSEGDYLQFRLRHRACIRKDPVFGTLNISAKNLIEQSPGNGQGICRDLRRKKGKARPDIPFVIQLSAHETDADGNAKIALNKAITDVADNNVESVGAAVNETEMGTTQTIVDHLSTLSEKLGAMSVITDRLELLAELHPYAKIAWTVCSSLYRAVQRQHLTDSSLASLVKTMSDTYSIVDELRDLHDKIKSLEVAIALILQQIIECSLFIREYVYRSFSGRVFEQLWKDQSSKVQDFVAGFERIKQDLDRATIRAGILIVSRVNEDVTKLLESNYIKSLKPSQMSRANRRLCLPGTRKRVLDEITENMLQLIQNTGETTKNVFWLHGMAGSGKSTVANTISQRFDRLGRRGAYLFFEKSKSDPTTVIRTIAHQLALFDSTLCTGICESIRTKPSIVDESLHDQFDKLLLHPLQAAADKLSGPIVIVLDALDECGDAHSRRDLLGVLVEGLSTLPHFVRFLITSRADLDIHTSFSNSDHIASMELAVGKEESTSDVQAYMWSELKVVRNLRGLSTSWPTESQVETLSSSSEGLFIWASTVCRLIGDALRPISKLAELIAGSEGGTLKGLDTLYATTLGAVCTWDDNDRQSWELYRSVVAVVLFYPVHVDDATVDAMFNFSNGESSQLVLNQLRCLLDYSPNHPIRPLHASFRDYLTDASRSGDKPWSLSPIDSEYFIAECCMRVMSSQLHFNMYDIKTSCQRDRDYFKVNNKAAISPELSYACKNWYQHLKSAQTLDKSDPLVLVLSDYCSEHLLSWLEVVSIMGIFRDGKVCQGVAELMRENNADQVALWEDARHFVDQFFAMNFWEHTPHIYLSSLPFTPPTSKISQIYLPKFLNTLKVAFRQINSPPDNISSTGYLSHLGFSSDGTMLISCFGEGGICIRSVQDYSLIPQYQTCRHPDGIRVAKFSPDNHFLYCLTWEGALVSWESTHGQFTEIHPIDVSDFDIFDEKIIACCDDGNLRVWIRSNSELTGPDTIHIGDKPLKSVSVSSDGLAAVSQSHRGKVSVCIVGIISLYVIKTITCSSSLGINALSFSDDSSYIAMAALDRRLQIYLCSLNECKITSREKRKMGHTWGTAITWLRGKPIVCMGWNDGTASLWNVETQRLISVPLHHSIGDCQVSISPDGKTLATGTTDHCIKIWDVEMLLGQEESGAGDPSQMLKTENPQLFEGCKYEDEWLIGTCGERWLWVPQHQLELNPALRYTTLSGTIKELDFSRFVYGEEWTKCYSGNMGEE